MLIVKIISLMLGLAFSIFGYFIYFKKKYSLINGFLEDFKAGRKDENYAKKVGIIELIIGIILLVICLFIVLFA